MKKELSPVSRRVWGGGFIVGLILLWALLAVLVHDSFMLPGPVDVWQSFWTNKKEILTVHLPATMLVVLAGGGLSIVFGAVMAVLMDLFAPVRKAVYPLLLITQTVPVMCIAPVFVLWLGYTVQMRILVVVLTNFFPVTVDLYDGLKAVSPEKKELMRSFHANRIQTFALLKMPFALPYFFSALHVAVPWGVTAAAVAEWLGAPTGLGTYSRNCMMQLDAAGLLAPLFVLTIVALLMNGIVTMIEKKTITWEGEN